jgi:hypothetical protein
MRRWDKPGGYADYKLWYPEGVEYKLRYVFQSQFFERVILPKLKKGDKRRGQLRTFLRQCAPKKKITTNGYLAKEEGSDADSASTSKQTAEINYVKHLQHVADSFQVTGWRQARYVRCPDVAWHVHPGGKHLPASDSERVAFCLNALASNKSAILELPAGVTPLDLAAALWHINMVLRNRIPLPEGRPPMFSWTFIRGIEEELDNRFWQVVWHQLGATAENFEEFCRTATPHAAAKTLAQALNVFAPRIDSPSHRAPDILVLIGTNRLSASLERAKNPLARAHAVKFVLEQISQPRMLDPVDSSRMRTWLGETRVILFPSDVPLEGPCDFSEIATENEMALFNAVRTFRFGFTQQMAASLWSPLDAVVVRSYLRKFVSCGALRYGQGEYHVPGEVGSARGDAPDRATKAKLHYAAGLSLAPYLSPADMPALAFDKAFFPVNVHEANYHFNAAHELLDNRVGDRFRYRVQTALRHVQCFAEYPQWSVVKGLNESGATKDAYEMALHLLENRAAIHSESFLIAGIAIERRWCDLRFSPGYEANREEADDLQTQMKAAYVEAMKACELPEFQSERTFNRLKVVTAYATLIRKYKAVLAWEAPDDTLDQLTKEAWHLLSSAADNIGSAAKGEWYESEGDCIKEHREALEAYRLGTLSVAEWRQLWIKFIGCISLINSTDARQVLSTIGQEQAEQILQKGLSGVSRDKNPNPWVRQRWTAGVFGFTKHFPELNRLTAEYSKRFARWK